MIELNDFFTESQSRIKKGMIALSGKLEAFVGSYFVRGEGWERPYMWLIVYYDARIDGFTEAVKPVKENIVAYVDPNYRWAFVISSHMEKFREDTAEYGITLIPVDSFTEEILRCSDINMLPDEFKDIVWVDDDFMNDENIPFDYDSFDIIDSGVRYLNPKHFSVRNFMKAIEELYRHKPFD